MELGHSILYAIFYSITRNDLISYAAIFIFSIVLTGFFTYKIARVLGAEYYTAILAGAIIGFHNYHFTHVPHIQLLGLYWALMPLYFILAYLIKNKPRDLWLVLLTMIPLCAGPSYNLVVFSVAYGLIFLFYTPSALSSRPVRLKLLRILGVSIIAVVMVSPLLLEYLKLFRGGNFRNLADHSDLKLDLIHLVLAPENNRMYGAISKKFYKHELYAIASAFPGFIVFCLTLWAYMALLSRYRTAQWRAENYRSVVAVAILAPLFLLMALGPAITWSGHFLILNPVYPLVAKTHLISATRFIAYYAYPALCVAAIVIALVLTRRLKGTPRKIRVVILGGALLGVLLENKPTWPIANFVENDTYKKVSAVYSFLAQLPENKGVIFLPLPAKKGGNSGYLRQFEHMKNARLHRLWMVNGVSGFFPPTYERAESAFLDFPSGAALAWIADFGVNYIVLDRRTPEYERIREKEIPNYCDLGKKIYDTGDYAILEVQQSRVKACLDERFVADPQHLSLQVLQLSAPTHVRIGSTIRVRVVVKNSGPYAWPRVKPRGEYEPTGQTLLGIERWVNVVTKQPAENSDGGLLQTSSPFLHDVMPGATVELSLESKVPAEPGTYDLNLGLLLQGVQWVAPSIPGTARVLVDF